MDLAFKKVMLTPHVAMQTAFLITDWRQKCWASNGTARSEVVPCRCLVADLCNIQMIMRAIRRAFSYGERSFHFAIIKSRYLPRCNMAITGTNINLPTLRLCKRIEQTLHTIYQLSGQSDTYRLSCDGQRLSTMYIKQLLQMQ